MTSEWMPVTSGAPKAVSSSVFRYINDIDLGLNNFISQFRDDTNIGDVVPSEWDMWNLKDLRKITDWSVKLEMPININKCQILQVGSRNTMKDCKMCDTEIKSIHSIKDLASQSHLTSSLKSQTGWWLWFKDFFRSRIKMLFFLCSIAL